MWVETVTEGGRRLMAAWRKEEGKPCAQFEHRKRRLGRPPSMKRGLHAFQGGHRRHGRFGTPEEEKGGAGKQLPES
ncbi:unnamed protein product [Ascophyllum nodosum]